MRRIGYGFVFVALGLLTACAGRGGVQPSRYHDQMSRQQFVAQCAADIQSGHSRISQAQVRRICACSYDGSMRTYGSVAGLARAHRSDRSAYRRNLARIAQACARKTLGQR